ncbi:hypothetical protein OF83DRAFT_1293074 [Amylostereum chailletii]|nr:hypothetical protein OF83DRAFT_1293074 [Amylostereum chailletii]
MDRKFIGPMPPIEFIDKFTTPERPQNEAPFLTRHAPGRPWTADSLINALDGSSLFPNLSFEDPAAFEVERDDDVLPHVAVSFAAASSTPHVRRKTDHATCDMIMELVPSNEDPFVDPAPDDNTPRSQLSFQRETNRALMHRRRLAYLILEMFVCRARIFVFSVIILKNKARLIRTDRSGAVVTELFTWTEANSPLVIFLRRFNAMSREDRGFDPTVTPPSPEEIRIARNAFVREDIDADYPDFRMQKFHVHDEVTGAERTYVAGVPMHYSPNVVSKGTHGYIAADLDDGSLVWIKDSWRLNKAHVRKEADVYRMLVKAEIPHVSSMLYGGDVEGQESCNQNFVDAPWACETDGVSHGKIHHRTVVSSVGRSLKDFTCTHELTAATRDAIEAHRAVFEKLKLLHGDISSGNILITNEGRGILIGWDMAIDVAQGNYFDLTGTWEFMSAALQEGEGNKPRALQDDLESFVHVYVYHILRYRPTGVRSPLGRLESVYRTYVPGKPSNYSTNGKFSFFGGVSISNAELNNHICSSAHSLVKELRRLFFRAIYADDTDIDPDMRPPAIEKLATSAHILELFDTALKGRDWATGDGSQDVLGEDDHDDSGTAKTGKRAASAASGREGSPSSKRLCTTSCR